MRLIHTGDWHLGQTLGGFSRDREHARFLAWLGDVVVDEGAEAVLVCGDVFDQGNPPATALARWYDFVADLRRRAPGCALVVIGGNHDAAPRLDAPAPVLRSLGVHVIGALPRTDDGRADPPRCLVQLDGAVIAAVPFLRMADLPAHLERDASPAQQLASPARSRGTPQAYGAQVSVDVVAAGVGDVYARVLDAAREKAGALPVVALGHLHMKGGKLTDESERPVFGNAHALPSSLFERDGANDVAYVALGHLHFAQQISAAPRVHYSGSPIPLTMAERDYVHRVLVVDVDAGGVRDVRARVVPRSVDLVRIDEDAVDVVLDRVRTLDVSPLAHDEPPFLEVRVKLDEPVPDLRSRVEHAIEARPASLGAVRLVRVHRVLAGDGEALADAVTSSLRDLEPVHVLERMYARSYGGAVPDDVAAAFGELLELERGERGDA